MGVLIALTVILAITLATALIIIRRPAQGTSGPSFDMYLLFVVGLVLIACVIGIFTIGVSRAPALTALLAILGLLAGAGAWAFKHLLDTLQRRAQLLIRELLATGTKTRPEIRAYVYQENYLYRWIRSVYVDALSSLLDTGQVKLTPDQRYVLQTTSPG